MYFKRLTHLCILLLSHACAYVNYTVVRTKFGNTQKLFLKRNLAVQATKCVKKLQKLSVSFALHGVFYIFGVVFMSVCNQNVTVFSHAKNLVIPRLFAMIPFCNILMCYPAI